MISYNGKVVTRSGNWIYKRGAYNPLNLPPFTLRVQYKPNVAPNVTKGSRTQVSTSPNVWDITYEDSDWRNLFSNETDLWYVIGGNTLGVTSMINLFSNCTSLISVTLFDTFSVTNTSSMFYNCSYLTSVPLFDMSNVDTAIGMFDQCQHLESVPLFNLGNVLYMTLMFAGTHLTTVPAFDTHSAVLMNSMFEGCRYLETVPIFNTATVTSFNSMFYRCQALQSVPLFDTSSATDTVAMFYKCRMVEEGALALYQQASSQTNPPSEHGAMFEECGADTTNGAAELAQIPSSWGGLHLDY